MSNNKIKLTKLRKKFIENKNRPIWWCLGYKTYKDCLIMISKKFAGENNCLRSSK